MPIRTLLVALFLAATVLPATADYDAKLEAEEAAKIKAERDAEARRKAAADRQRAAAEQKGMRQTLGKEAEGKSDAEVKRLYEAKMKGYTDQAKKAQSGGGWAMTDSQRANAAAGDAQMKSMTGKSMADLEKMNEKELEAFGKQMEKQYGGGK